LIFCQEKIRTGGFYYTHFIPFSPLKNEYNGKNEPYSLAIRLQSGYSSGMMVKWQFSHSFVLESGLGYTKRTYAFQIQSFDSVNISGRYSLISYELPINMNVQIQLEKKWFAFSYGGGTLHYFPSNLATSGDFYAHVSLRNRVFIPSVNAGIGFEYRNKEYGIFRIAAAFNRMIDFIIQSHITYVKGTIQKSFVQNIMGNYFGICLTYYFYDTQKE
jgi:hypothetical protein